MASPIVAQIALLLEQLPVAEQEQYLAGLMQKKIRIKGHGDRFLFIAPDGTVVGIQSADPPEGAEESWVSFTKMLQERVTSVGSEPLREGARRKIQVMLSALDDRRKQNYIDRENEDTFSPDQKKFIRQTTKALVTAAKKLDGLGAFGIQCYADAVVHAGAPPLMYGFADDLRAFAGAMDQKLKSAPRVGSKSDKISTARCIELRRWFLKMRLPYPMRPWDLDELNLYLRACGEEPVTTRTFNRDRDTIC